MSKPKLEWSNKSDDADLRAALKYLSLLAPAVEAQAMVQSLRHAKPVDHAAKDLLRAAGLPLLPREEPHVDEDLKRIEKGKPLAPVLAVRGARYHPDCRSSSRTGITGFALSAISTKARPFPAGL